MMDAVKKPEEQASAVSGERPAVSELTDRELDGVAGGSANWSRENGSVATAPTSK
jgi:hypothetical protein